MAVEAERGGAGAQLAEQVVLAFAIAKGAGGAQLGVRHLGDDVLAFGEQREELLIHRLDALAELREIDFGHRLNVADAVPWS